MKDKIQIFVFAVLLSVLFIIGFLACTDKSTSNIEQSVASDEMLVVIEDHALSGYYIVYDKDTKIMYYQGVSHGACLNPLYNPDGTLKLYNGGKP